MDLGRQAMSRVTYFVKEYMRRLRPLVEGASVVRGNTAPIDVIGYDV
jgi:hypothetical protein